MLSEAAAMSSVIIITLPGVRHSIATARQSGSSMKVGNVATLL